MFVRVSYFMRYKMVKRRRGLVVGGILSHKGPVI